ncbi:MAG TPA: MFS transporter [Kofleriaceae bacterium]|jgi:MFS family permease
MGRAGRFTLLGALYFAQGLPFGFFGRYMPIILRSAGWSLTKIGVATLLAVPWALKFLWAPFVDKHYSQKLGRRRTWILAMQVAGVVALGLISSIPGTEEIHVLLASMLVLNFIAATQDIATDGLAVDLLPPEERGFANGLQVGGYRLGMIVGGGALLILHHDLGHRVVFATMCILTALTSIPVLFSKEPEPRESVPEAVAKVHWLKLPGAWRLIALVVFYKFGEEFGKSMITTFLKDGGLGEKQIGSMIGVAGSVAGLVGALVGGALVGKLGRKQSLVVFGIGQVVTIAGYMYLALVHPSMIELYGWTSVEHFASGCATVALFTSMMDWCRPEHGGADYSVQASAQVIAIGVAPVIAGMSADALGYAGHFALSVVLCAAAVVAVLKLFPRSPFPPRSTTTAA